MLKDVIKKLDQEFEDEFTESTITFLGGSHPYWKNSDCVFEVEDYLKRRDEAIIKAALNEFVLYIAKWIGKANVTRNAKICLGLVEHRLDEFLKRKDRK